MPQTAAQFNFLPLLSLSFKLKHTKQRSGVAILGTAEFTLSVLPGNKKINNFQW